MSDLESNQSLQTRQQKIQEKRKQTSWRDFVREICSWIPLVFYKHANDISRYPREGRIKNLVTPKEFEELRSSFSQNASKSIINSNKNFIEQFAELYTSLPQPTRLIDPLAENASFAEAIRKSKNIYLSFIVIDDCENIGYSFYIQDIVTNTRGSMMVWNKCDIIFSSTAILQSYKIFYSRYITNCSNIWFSTNLIGCQECLFCDRLTNQSYCIHNTPYDKDSYFIEKERFLQKKNNFEERFSLLSYTSNNYNSHNVEGIFCIHSSDIKNGRYVYRTENGHNIMFVGHDSGRKNMYDCFGSDQVGEGNMYGCSNMGGSNHAYCCDCCIVSNCFYCFFCIQCSYCLGCIGLVNKSFCILNKQYTKEERYEKVDEIFGQMEKDGTLGEFFPGSICPFYFNDTAAYLIDPSFTKEEVTAKGYLWRDEPIKVDIPEGAKVVKTSDLDQYEGWHDNQRRIDPEILNVIIQDNQGNVYRIVKMEYDFLMKHWLPLPRKHRLDRMKENFRIQ